MPSSPHRLTPRQRSRTAWRALALGWREGLSQAPLHVLGIGFLAGMLVAMASRVSLGHSGRALEADRPTWGLFLTLMLAALTRALAEWATSLYTPLLFLSAALWLAAFGLWAWRYAPLYWRPRADGKAG
ncbi:MAG: NnrS family protein [Stenotrophomonas sp.]|uniref:NnrS family protein n=1 Tax=Stenotrophomonas sp. TaxID=69392 RepID=UPI00198CACBD|nr:NnrS family protein [Stenotrophomonas sp.]MBD3743436.1 NnrS family protein [Stenotrophomonas sp.]